MFENILKHFKKFGKKDPEELTSKEMAKERLHLVLMQDRANVSADFLDMMRQEIIDVIKKYIDVDEKDIDVRLTNKMNDDGTTGAPALYANIPIAGVKQSLQSTAKENESKEEKDTVSENKEKEVNKEEDKKEEKKLEENDKEKTEEKVEEKKDEDVISNTVKKEKKEPNKTKSNTKKNTKSTKKQKT